METLRPTNFDDVIGQSEVVDRLKIFAFGAKTSNSVMPHVLLDGPPGLGKTTLAAAIANELGSELKVANAASIRTVKNMTKYLLSINRGDVLFIDEIHRLPMLVEEYMYPVMEDFQAQIVLDTEPEEIDIPPFTLIGATTSGGSLSQPFYDRFMVKEHLTFYDVDELAKLAGSNAKSLNLNIPEDHLFSIAKRSKGTPRILKSRLEWYKNYTAFCPQEKDVDKIFNVQGIDENGFDENDLKYLDVLKKNRGNPIGIKSLSGMTGIAMDTIENSIEPFLVRMGYIIRTSKGRVIGKI